MIILNVKYTRNSSKAEQLGMRPLCFKKKTIMISGNSLTNYVLNYAWKFNFKKIVSEI